MFLDFSRLEMRYDPFPIGAVCPVMDETLYRELVADYPPRELFADMSKVGNKLALNPYWNGRQFKEFVAGHPRWRAFNRWIISADFIETVLQSLRERHVDLGFKARTNPLKKLLRNLRRGRIHTGQAPLTSRMEFSMLPADGGSVIPHTDAPGKIVTLVVTMVSPGEWNAEFGGGTDVNRPKNDRHRYNQRNQQAGFEEMDVLATYDFVPNQAVVFVKTFNSWHSVRPMTGRGSPLMRRTLTINIEAQQ
ncbi:hypothetical protein SAMN07250955_10172 [Arboricoccus pini]|uniref:2OG-Fe(II) oxygenase n=1 Tax=Arboricoccus pini TaxID=1963835 RepID=A0A212PWB7_9PROT|nr:hypothetical protein [Arboricoccus pini]SNB51318.1 hypothetical protein SAMN07250955_10172 [Arboricoccus pini]